MTIENAEKVSTASIAGVRLPFWAPLVLGFLVLAIPTLVNMARGPWTLESGAHGPIVLVTAFWLLHHDGLRLADADAQGRDWRLAILCWALAFPLYVFGRAFDFVSLEFVGLYGVFIGLATRLFGWRRLAAHAFPLFYLALAVPPPGWVIANLTGPLQSFVSAAAGEVAGWLGYPIARQGVVLFVGPYQLLVEEACSGLNSLFGLSAVSLFYIYLMHRASWRYALVLLLAVIPIAVLVNIVRIVALIAITSRYGDATAQGFLHNTTGLVLSGVALLLIYALDSLLHPFAERWRRA